jgi:sugar O-acyltransferase (sialic acid O-acetyltransferase NeuD family)
MSRIVLFGAGRGASVAHRFFAGDTEHEVVGFAIDGALLAANEYRGLPLVAFEDVERRFPPETCRMHVLLGYQQMNGLRERKFGEAKAKGYTLESYVASDIFRVEPISVGENCFILDNQSISLDVTIGNNVVMWSSNHVGDMSTIEDHAWLASHVTIAANVTIGERAFIGVGATVSNHVKIGAETLVGANLMVSNDTEPKSVHVFGQGKLDVESRPFMRMMMASKKL